MAAEVRQLSAQWQHWAAAAAILKKKARKESDPRRESVPATAQPYQRKFEDCGHFRARETSMNSRQVTFGGRGASMLKRGGAA